MLDDEGLIDRDGDYFYRALGYCIAAWSDIEKRLFDLCHHSMRSDVEVASIVYYRTPSIDARLTLTDEMIRLRLPKTPNGGRPHPTLKIWNELRAKIKSHLEVRNRLAHHPVSLQKIIVENALTAQGQVRQEYLILQTSVGKNEALRGKHFNQIPLYLGDLEAHCLICRGLADEIMYFLLTKIQADGF